MSFVLVTSVVGFVVFSGLVTTCGVCLSRQQLQEARDELDSRVLEVAPYLGLGGLFFVLRRAVEGPSRQVSAAIGLNISDEIYALEGMFVAVIQDMTPDALIPLFSAFYMFGFTFLLLTPVALYALVPALRPLKQLLIAYVLNYTAGTILFTVFTAYGPRVHISSHVEGLMYEAYPETAALTSTVSDRADVFPSLHTSLAVIVLLFAWQTRHALPRWVPVAAVVANGIILSTMVLGIHWFIDVVAGIFLAVGCVAVSKRILILVEGRRKGRLSHEERSTET